MGIIKQVFIGIVVAGALLALLDVFGGDPFAVLAWGLDWIIELITSVRDFLAGNEHFQDATAPPDEIMPDASSGKIQVG